MIRELEAKLKLSDDDVFYLRHNNITLTHEVEHLRKENAALRADKERLDYLERNGNLLRLTIDAARKEAQP